MDGKQLYLCYSTSNLAGTRSLVVLSLDLSQIGLSRAVTAAASSLRPFCNPSCCSIVARICDGYKHIPLLMGCGAFDSQIIFAGGVVSRNVYTKEIIAVETDTSQSINNDTIPDFLSGKPMPVLIQPRGQGRLYALAGARSVLEKTNGSHTFEVFDPDKGEWSALPDPPFFSAQSREFRDVEVCTIGYAVADTILFIFLPRGASSFLFRIDLALSRKFWVPHFYHSWSRECCMAYSMAFRGYPLIVEHVDGKRFIMFSYEDCPGAPTPLRGYRMGTRAEYFDLELLVMKDLPPLPAGFYQPAEEYRLVHLGGTRVCLVLTTFIEGKVEIALVCFNYKYKPAGDHQQTESLEIKFLENRIICKEMGDGDDTFTADLIGAFFIGGSLPTTKSSARRPTHQSNDILHKGKSRKGRRKKNSKGRASEESSMQRSTQSPVSRGGDQGNYPSCVSSVVAPEFADSESATSPPASDPAASNHIQENKKGSGDAVDLGLSKSEKSYPRSDNSAHIENSPSDSKVAEKNWHIKPSQLEPTVPLKEVPSEVAKKAVEATSQLPPDSNRSVAKHATFPNHIQIPEAFKNVLTFGSIDASFGLRVDSVNGTGGNNFSLGAVDSSQLTDGTPKEPFPRNDISENPPSLPNVLENLPPPSEGNISSSTDKVDCRNRTHSSYQKVCRTQLL